MPTGRPSGENVFSIGAERLAPSIEYIKDVSAIHHEEVAIIPEHHSSTGAQAEKATPEQIAYWNKGVTAQICSMREEALRNVA